jgi:tetratricopeptide (TPR) repeat protein
MKMSSKASGELVRLQSFLRDAGSNISAINQAAALLEQRSFPLESALKAYQDYLMLHPGAAAAAFNYAWYLSRDGQFETAIGMYQKALELGISQPEEVHLNIANLFMDQLAEHEKAREAFHRALQLNPRFVSAHYNLGNLAEQLGDREQASRHFERCLELDTGNESALARLADAHRFKEKNDPLLSKLLARAQTSDSSDLHFALGAAFNQLADFDLAWRHFSKANDLDRKTAPAYNRKQAESFFSQIAEKSNPDRPQQFPGRSQEPVFICGMFRTGSTLLEQVLSVHPHFTAGGESEFFPRLVLKEFHDYPQGLDDISNSDIHAWAEYHAAHSHRITGGLNRLTDKRPDNFLHIGLIKAIVPSARFIVTERDWRDVALSIYSTRLGVTQNYSTNLADIRHYIGLQKQLVDHWTAVLGGDIQRISYEDLVRTPRETITRVLNTLGEDWDECCLSFDKQDNAVSTASVWQVREPLHTKSIGRWENYKPYFEDAFGDHLAD